MPTINQLIKNKRQKKKHYKVCPLLVKNPHLKGFCLKVTTMKPKKPNSAIRKIVKVFLSNGKKIRAYVPGQGHNLQEHSVVLIKGGKVNDLPGIHYKLVRGKYDFSFRESFIRAEGRSKYGIPKPQ